MPSIRATAIIANYNVAILKADRKAKTALRNFLRREANHWHTKLNHTVDNWNHKVTFKVGTTLRTNENIIGISITTNDAIFGFLDEGTAYRTRRMEPDYVPKSQPESFMSHGEGGRVAGVARMPGIEARGWFEFIERDFQRHIEDTTTEILQDFSQEANNW